MKLTGKTVLVTGASSGLGRAVAQKLSYEGCSLVLAARRLDRLNELKKELKTECISVKTDVTNEKDVLQLFEAAQKRFGKVDILVCSAGINDKKLFYEYTSSEWDTIMDTNAKSVFLCAKEFEKQNNSGVIAVVSSVAGLFGAKHYSLYCASKHAIDGFCRSIRKETKSRVHVFHPYRLRTEFHKNYKVKSPEKHMIEPELYAEYVVARIKGDVIRSTSFFLRNMFLWIAKSIF